MSDEETIIPADQDVQAATVYPEDWQSETRSIGSSIYEGLIQNGRRYQSLSHKEYLIPSDEQMFDAYEAGHLLALVLDSHNDNPLFRSPIGDDPKQILDLGTGKGTWAVDVADMFPRATVRGVDLFPPPVTYIPPNCVLEIDDALEEWTWRESFDLIHMRIMIGSFDPKEWDKVYEQSYQNIRPGGWIEQLEASPCIECDDGTLPEDSILRDWGPMILACGKAAGRACDTIDTMPDTIRKAGFIEVHEKKYKWPIGAWPRDQRYKEAGTVNFQHWMDGMEGWCMWLLTKFGSPEPWSREQVIFYVAKIRAELKNPGYHIYQRARRVWARKPHYYEVLKTPDSMPEIDDTPEPERPRQRS